MPDNAFSLHAVRSSQDGGGRSLLEAAVRVREARKVRSSLFGASVFVDPNWDILIELYIAQGEQRSISAADLCVDINMGWQSMVRWIRALRSAGLVEGYPTLAITENMPIMLSRQGDEKLAAYLTVAP